MAASTAASAAAAAASASSGFFGGGEAPREPGAGSAGTGGASLAGGTGAGSGGTGGAASAGGGEAGAGSGGGAAGASATCDLAGEAGAGGASGAGGLAGEARLGSDGGRGAGEAGRGESRRGAGEAGRGDSRRGAGEAGRGDSRRGARAGEAGRGDSRRGARAGEAGRGDAARAGEATPRRPLVDALLERLRLRRSSRRPPPRPLRSTLPPRRLRLGLLRCGRRRWEGLRFLLVLRFLRLLPLRCSGRSLRGREAFALGAGGGDLESLGDAAFARAGGSAGGGGVGPRARLESGFALSLGDRARGSAGGGGVGRLPLLWLRDRAALGGDAGAAVLVGSSSAGVRDLDLAGVTSLASGLASAAGALSGPLRCLAAAFALLRRSGSTLARGRGAAFEPAAGALRAGTAGAGGEAAAGETDARGEAGGGAAAAAGICLLLAAIARKERSSSVSSASSGGGSGRALMAMERMARKESDDAPGTGFTLKGRQTCEPSWTLPGAPRSNRRSGPLGPCLTPVPLVDVSLATNRGGSAPSPASTTSSMCCAEIPEDSNKMSHFLGSRPTTTGSSPGNFTKRLGGSPGAATVNTMAPNGAFAIASESSPSGTAGMAPPLAPAVRWPKKRALYDRC